MRKRYFFEITPTYLHEQNTSLKLLNLTMRGESNEWKT